MPGPLLDRFSCIAVEKAGSDQNQDHTTATRTVENEQKNLCGFGLGFDSCQAHVAVGNAVGLKLTKFEIIHEYSKRATRC